MVTLFRALGKKNPMTVCATSLWALFQLVLVLLLTDVKSVSGQPVVAGYRVLPNFSKLVCNETCAATNVSGFIDIMPKSSPYPFDDHHVTWNEEDCEQEYDSEEFETLYQARRVDKVKMALKWSECIANPWPEIDLPWCIADWHESLLPRES